MGDLGVNEHHQDQLVQLLRFCRSSRAQRVRSIEACFDETKHSKLNDSTFTRDEVNDLLEALNDAVRAEMHCELIDMAHTSLLLLRQVAGQAEVWRLNLRINLSELENRQLLDAVKQFEERQFSGEKPENARKTTTLKKQKSATALLRRLEPLRLHEEGEASDHLQTEIERLRYENEQMRNRMQTATDVTVCTDEQKQAIETQLERVKQQAAENKTQDQSVYDEQIAQLQRTLEAIRGTLNESATKTVNEDKLKNELLESHKRLLEVKAQLSLTESELDKKFSQTAAYKNMKQMLVKKNKQIREMRQKLNKYEPENDNNDED